MPLTDREMDPSLQKASPKTIIHQGHTFTATLINGMGGRISLMAHRPPVVTGVVAVAFDDTPHAPDTVFGYALGAHQDFDSHRRTIKNGLTLEQAIAACCEAMIEAREEHEQRADLERQGRNRLYEWYIQAPLQE